MLDTAVVIAISLAYLGILFGVAFYGDRRAQTGRSLTRNPAVEKVDIACGQFQTGFQIRRRPVPVDIGFSEAEITACREPPNGPPIVNDDARRRPWLRADTLDPFARGQDDRDFPDLDRCDNGGQCAREKSDPRCVPVQSLPEYSC